MILSTNTASPAPANTPVPQQQIFLQPTATPQVQLRPVASQSQATLVNQQVQMAIASTSAQNVVNVNLGQVNLVFTVYLCLLF